MLLKNGKIFVFFLFIFFFQYIHAQGSGKKEYIFSIKKPEPAAVKEVKTFLNTLQGLEYVVYCEMHDVFLVRYSGDETSFQEEVLDKISKYFPEHNATLKQTGFGDIIFHCPNKEDFDPIKKGM